MSDNTFDTREDAEAAAIILDNRWLDRNATGVFCPKISALCKERCRSFNHARVATKRLSPQATEDVYYPRSPYCSYREDFCTPEEL